MPWTFGQKALEVPDAEIEKGLLRVSSASSLSHEELAERLAEDGYLYFKGADGGHPAALVDAARGALLKGFAEQGRVDAGAHELALGVESSTAATLSTSVRANLALQETAEFQALFAPGAPLQNTMSKVFGKDATNFNFKWLRAAGAGAGSPIHCDSVYMNRGTKNLCTAWSCITDVPTERGSLALCLGSQRFDVVKETYANIDVDRDSLSGSLGHDPREFSAGRFAGGRWATADFEAGDVLVFGMHLLHASLTNVDPSRRLRISCDTRWQPSDEEMDRRWVNPISDTAGETHPDGNPNGHYAGMWRPGVPMNSMEDKRKEWGF